MIFSFIAASTSSYSVFSDDSVSSLTTVFFTLFSVTILFFYRYKSSCFSLRNSVNPIQFLLERSAISISLEDFFFNIVNKGRGVLVSIVTKSGYLKLYIFDIIKSPFITINTL